MKKYLLLLVLVLSLGCLPAQQLSPWQNLRHSSVDPLGDLHIRWESGDPGLSAPQFWTRLGSDDWQMQEITSLGGLSYEATPQYSWGQRIRYRLRNETSMEGETVAIMQAAWMDEDSFPPPTGKLALIGNDPAGDSVMIQASMLDLGDSWMGVSNQKLFSTIANQSGSFPTMNSLTSFNAWISTIANPEALADSVAYAMVYTFNIAGVISPGLYKLGMDETMTPTFERIGNIQSSVSGGKLNLACNMADLISDPGFGTWPNQTNSLMFSSFSMRLNLDLSTMEPEILIGDYSSPGIIYFEDLQYQVQQNTLPQVSGLAVNGLQVSFFYQDAEGDFPLICQFTPQDGNILPMTATSHDYVGGVTYTTMLSEPIQQGLLELSDNLIQVLEYPWSYTPSQDPVQTPAALRCQFPNPLRAGRQTQIGFFGLETGILQMEIYNLRGQKLLSLSHDPGSESQASINWNGLINGRVPHPGVYLLRVRQGSRQLNRKFSIIN